jgi:hypothetical protein
MEPLDLTQPSSSISARLTAPQDSAMGPYSPAPATSHAFHQHFGDPPLPSARRRTHGAPAPSSSRRSCALEDRRRLDSAVGPVTVRGALPAGGSVSHGRTSPRSDLAEDAREDVRNVRGAGGIRPEGIKYTKLSALIIRPNVPARSLMLRNLFPSTGMPHRLEHRVRRRAHVGMTGNLG